MLCTRVGTGQLGEPWPEVFKVILTLIFPWDEEVCWFRCLCRHTGLFNVNAKIQE